MENGSTGPGVRIRPDQKQLIQRTGTTDQIRATSVKQHNVWGKRLYQRMTSQPLKPISQRITVPGVQVAELGYRNRTGFALYP
jgi:hypothetical protein